MAFVSELCRGMKLAGESGKTYSLAVACGIKHIMGLALLGLRDVHDKGLLYCGRFPSSNS